MVGRLMAALFPERAPRKFGEERLSVRSLPRLQIGASQMRVIGASVRSGANGNAARSDPKPQLPPQLWAACLFPQGHWERSLLGRRKKAMVASQETGRRRMRPRPSAGRREARWAFFQGRVQ